MKILAKNIQKIVLIFLFCTLNAQAFFPGEKYEYDVYYKFIRIGHAYMETSKEIDMYNTQTKEWSEIQAPFSRTY